MKKGAIKLTPGTKVIILRRGFLGRSGLLKRRTRDGRLVVNVMGAHGGLAASNKLYLDASEVQPAETP